MIKMQLDLYIVNVGTDKTGYHHLVYFEVEVHPPH